MNDLISRQAVLEYLRELCETKDTSAYGLQLMGNYEAMKNKIAERDCVISIIREIESIEIAYDVNKVVEHIREQDGVCTGCKRTDECNECSIGERIKIIKGGGKDE